MSRLRTCSFAILGSLALLMPASLAASLPLQDCDKLRSDLSRQARVLKQQQADEMKSCETANGSHSQACRDLAERQKEDMRQLKEYASAQLRGCDFFFYPAHYYHQTYYQNSIYYHHRHPRPYRRDGHGDRGRDARAAPRERSVATRAGSFGHVAGGGSWHGGGGHMSGGGFWGGHAGGGYSGGGGYSAGHSAGASSGGSSGGGGAAASGGGGHSK